MKMKREGCASLFCDTHILSNMALRKTPRTSTPDGFWIVFFFFFFFFFVFLILVLW